MSIFTYVNIVFYYWITLEELASSACLWRFIEYHYHALWGWTIWKSFLFVLFVRLSLSCIMKHPWARFVEQLPCVRCCQVTSQQYYHTCATRGPEMLNHTSSCGCIFHAKQGFTLIHHWIIHIWAPWIELRSFEVHVARDPMINWVI